MPPRRLAFFDVVLASLALVYWLPTKDVRHRSMRYIQTSMQTTRHLRNTTTAAAATDEFECPIEPCHLNIVFIGDSVTRYMYISLVFFLRFNNTWLEPGEQPNPTVAQTYFDEYECNVMWTSYYNDTMSRLAPYENCDCFRGPGFSYRKPISENRYYFDPTRNNTITYIQAFGSRMINGHWHDPVEASRIPSRVLQEGNNQSALGQEPDPEVPLMGPMPAILPAAWGGSWVSAIEHIAPIRPNHLIMNAGKHENNFHQPVARQELINATQAAGIPRVVWKTTTSSRVGRYPERERVVDYAMCELMECFDITSLTKALPRRFYQDQYHFYEPVYRKMNERLFDFLNVSVPADPLEWEMLNISEALIQAQAV